MKTVILVPSPLLVSTFSGFLESLLENGQVVACGFSKGFCANMDNESTKRERRISLLVFKSFSKFKPFWC
jgi:hypothetical protein